MDFIVLFALLGSFAWLAVFADRRIEARRQARLTDAQSASVRKLGQGWFAYWRRPKNLNDVHAFRIWAVTTFADQPAMQHWLAALSDDAIQLLIDKISEFCSDLGFSFDWLLTQKIDLEVTLAPHLHTIAAQYIEACYQAYLVQDDVKVFQVWQDFTQHPYRKGEQALAQRLLTELLAQGLTPHAAQSLLLAPEKEREIYIVQAVREAAEKHPAAFGVVLKSVVTAPTDVPPAPETTHRSRRGWLRRAAQADQPLVSEQPTVPVA